ncbi:hypothetical protein OAH87_01725 [Marinomonas sp.]|nr:hypothetical protein [Marinomonas sp.]MDB4837165.1 hypothetical protein [Marinomonas sp.]
MKRLYYVTKDLDDAEIISNEVHLNGIDDHHFFVVSRDEKGIKTHHLHGSDKFENTSLIASGNRAYFIGGGLALSIMALALLNHLFSFAPSIPIFLLMTIAFMATITVKLASRSFDSYLMGRLNQHLELGEAVVVIDVSRNQVKKVETMLEQHPKAEFIADCSNIGAAIPE